MRMVDLIEKKRDGKRLLGHELDFIIQGLVKGEIPDYQVAAWCMAVLFQGLEEEEVVALTRAMIANGSVVDLSSIEGPTVDKHSTGGVGDKTSLVLAPILASLGAVVAKMSGHGLGHTGGTLDKLESIPGLRTSLTAGEFVAQAERIGLVIAGQTDELVPADKKLYALRDVTGTVPSIPLIAASIMSKKLAVGAGAIMLDVKYGSGALLVAPGDGTRLARMMMAIGRAFGARVGACLSSMEQPLGRAVGNALEVGEALATLRGEGPEDLREICLAMAAELQLMAGLATDREHAREKAVQAIGSGAALRKLGEMIQAQGGRGEVIDRPELLPTAKATTLVLSRASGYLARIDTAGLGRVAMRLGAGRATKEERIDPAAGLVFLVRLGDWVDQGTPLAELHTNRLAEIEPAQQDLRSCLGFSAQPVPVPPLFLVGPGQPI